MIRWQLCSLLGSLLWGLSIQAADPPVKLLLSQEVRAELAMTVADLRREVQALRSAPSAAQSLRDVEIGIEAVDRSLRYDELDKKDSADQARAVLSFARQRIARIQSSDLPWAQSPGRTVLGYRSKIDDTVQPYAITIPEGYSPSGATNRYPLYIELHGRGDQSEVPFIRRHMEKPVAPDQTWIQLDVFGRGNNGYRYAGETDVFEALADVRLRYRIDDQRIVLWGFSMGGAGAWHLGLHYPAKWCAVGAGAGFVDFYKYQKVESQLPSYQHRTLSIYDSTHYAMNLANVPFITYGGENDAQLVASTTMRDLAQPLNVPLQVVIGPQMGHKFDDASKRTFMEFLKTHAESGLPPSADRRRIRFVTCTVKYNECDWLQVEEQTVPYEESVVESEVQPNGTLHLKTRNVAALSVSRSIAERISIDTSGEFPLADPTSSRLPVVDFVKQGESWQPLNHAESLAFREPATPRKRRDLQGPIDDAFSQPFLCVRGTGTPWSPSHQAYADWNLTRFQSEFDQWMRGQARTIDDTAITDELIQNNNLILFGDPGSNVVLARVLEHLPLNWTKEEVTFSGTSYNPDLHCMSLIFPNPLNPRRYVVLNSGHTLHQKDFQSSNAQLYPRLGDGGVIRFRPDTQSGFGEEIVAGEIFDSGWKIPD